MMKKNKEETKESNIKISIDLYYPPAVSPEQAVGLVHLTVRSNHFKKHYCVITKKLIGSR
jgi:hypothetical protein